MLRETTAPRISVHCLLTSYERADKRETRKPQMFETVLLAAHPTDGLAYTPIGITPYPLRAPHRMTGCAMLSADHDKRYGFRTLRAREHRSKRVHASSSILRAPSHVSSSVVARCLLALFMFDVSALARIHERCTHDSVRRLREVVSFGLRVKMCVWLGVSRGLDLAFLNAD